MSKLIKIMAGLSFVSIGLAAPGTSAHASVGQDQEFYWLLTRPDQDHPMVIWNFAQIRSEAIGACEREDAGESPYQALKDLQYPNGPYTFDDANSITSAAEVIYCPWHKAPVGETDWSTTSAPVYPRPVYPSLAWYPPPAYPPPGYSPAGY